MFNFYDLFNQINSKRIVFFQYNLKIKYSFVFLVFNIEDLFASKKI